jgi:transcriptional regulator of acetoin/glycerol metabolism
MPGPKPRFTKDELINLIHQHTTFRAIGKAMGVSGNSIATLASRHGIKSGKPREVATDLEIVSAFEKHNGNITHAANAAGICRPQYYARLKELIPDWALRANLKED